MPARKTTVENGSAYSNTRRVSEMPSEERPRERLEKVGAEHLSTSELLAILLRTGTARLSVLDVAENLVRDFQNITNLSNAAVDQVMRAHGIGRVKAIELKAALELGKRINKLNGDTRPVIQRGADVENLLMAEMRHLPHEEFRVLLLNTRNQVLAMRTVSKGILNSSLVHPREVFRPAVEMGTNSILCVHNHPSGDPTPSTDDIAITKRLVDAGNLMDIRVLDHVIIGDGRSISLREKGLM